MHMVIANAHAGDPYRIDTLFLYMANMAWNSSMNSAETMRMLTAKEGDDYVIPRIIYSDAYASEMVAYADLIRPTRPTSNATTASRCSTGRSRTRCRGRQHPLAGGRARPRGAGVPVRCCWTWAQGWAFRA